MQYIGIDLIFEVVTEIYYFLFRTLKLARKIDLNYLNPS